MHRLFLIFIFVSLTACPRTKIKDRDLQQPRSQSTEIAKKVMTTHNVVGDKAPDEKGKHGENVTAEIVSKPFINKRGNPGQLEFYVRRSIQDYFIKFCESQVTKEELESVFEKSESRIVALEIEIIRKGSWDTCDEFPVQSRGGDYVIIHKIIE